MVRDACAVVLAGGESRRFGSDKALAQFRGEPLISRVVRELRAAGFAQVRLFGDWDGSPATAEALRVLAVASS